MERLKNEPLLLGMLTWVCLMVAYRWGMLPEAIADELIAASATALMLVVRQLVTPTRKVKP